MRLLTPLQDAQHRPEGNERKGLSERTGRSDWQKGLTERTGKKDWQKGLAERTGRKDWQKVNTTKHVTPNGTRSFYSDSSSDLTRPTSKPGKHVKVTDLQG